MSEPFLAEVRIMSFNFPPRGWAFCNGQILPIAQNQALFALLGTVFGGNGQTNFGLPNMQGRTPIHRGGGFNLGQADGEQNHTLVSAEMPAHFHVLNAATADATAETPTGALVLGTASINVYRTPTTLVPMELGIVGTTGGSQPHLNMQPFLALNFCICLQGIFPSQN
jgi:microcystin-dependent protein